MSDHASRTVGVVGSDAVAESLRDADVHVETGSVDAVPDTDSVVAVGQSAVAAVARVDGDPLVIPVEAGRGVRSVSRDAAPDALAALEAAHVEHHPILSVAVDGTPMGEAVWDAVLVTADAARISEYTVDTETDHVGTFRADGVAVATPAGSPGYTRRIGGPVAAPGPLSVVAPIAPFATSHDNWVLPVETVGVTVDRDEATVSLFLDGEDSGTVGHDERLTLTRTGGWRAAVVEQSRSRFD